MFGTSLSNRKQANSASLFSPSFKVAESQNEIHSHSRASFIRLLFHPTRVTHAVKVLRIVCIPNFLWFNGIQSLCSQPHLHTVIGWGKHTHSPPSNISSKPKHQNTDRGRGSADPVTTTRLVTHITWLILCMSIFCFSGKCYWLYLQETFTILSYSVICVISTPVVVFCIFLNFSRLDFIISSCHILQWLNDT